MQRRGERNEGGNAKEINLHASGFSYRAVYTTVLGSRRLFNSTLVGWELLTVKVKKAHELQFL